ncbi:MAG: hypothetical protein RR139_07870 [Lachnospiraceae bacterium]
MNTSDEICMTYSGLLMIKGKKIVRVNFQRNPNDYAEGIVPSGMIEKSFGFNQEELEQLSHYLKTNADDILLKAKEINPLGDWLKK